MSNSDGTWNNFIYSNGDRNVSHKNSEAKFGWWAIRGLRGLTAALNVFSNTNNCDSILVNQIVDRINSSKRHIYNTLNNYPSTHQTSLGDRPDWLINNAPDQTSELLLVLTKLHLTKYFNFENEIIEFGNGLLRYQFLDSSHPFNGMYFSWDNIWHNWGNNQSSALINAYLITGKTNFLNSVKVWADGFVQSFIHDDYYSEIEIQPSGDIITKKYPQIAYGFSSLYRGVKSLADLTGSKDYEVLAEQLFSWFVGNNVAKINMYSESNGRCYDGINGVKNVNLNSGAESTIECLLALQKRN
jgi:hypothetical protein